MCGSLVYACRQSVLCEGCTSVPRSAGALNRTCACGPPTWHASVWSTNMLCERVVHQHVMRACGPPTCHASVWSTNMSCERVVHQHVMRASFLPNPSPRTPPSPSLPSRRQNCYDGLLISTNKTGTAVEMEPAPWISMAIQCERAGALNTAQALVAQVRVLVFLTRFVFHFKSLLKFRMVLDLTPCRTCDPMACLSDATSLTDVIMNSIQTLQALRQPPRGWYAENWFTQVATLASKGGCLTLTKMCARGVTLGFMSFLGLKHACMCSNSMPPGCPPYLTRLLPLP
jgi:hypothetical protein